MDGGRYTRSTGFQAASPPARRCVASLENFRTMRWREVIASFSVHTESKNRTAPNTIPATLQKIDLYLETGKHQRNDLRNQNHRDICNLTHSQRKRKISDLP